MATENRGEAAVNPFAVSGPQPKDEALPTPNPLLMTLSVLIAVMCFMWGATVGVAFAAPDYIPQFGQPLLAAVSESRDAGLFVVSAVPVTIFGAIVFAGVFGRSPTAADLASCYFVVGTLWAFPFGILGALFIATDEKVAEVNPILRAALASLFATAPFCLGTCAWMTLRWRNELRRFRERLKAGVAYDK